MDSKEPIKELDPDYHRCQFCQRLMLEKDLLIARGNGTRACKDTKECDIKRNNLWRLKT